MFFDLDPAPDEWFIVDRAAEHEKHAHREVRREAVAAFRKWR